MTDNPVIKPGKKYPVNGRVVTIKPLSFFELTALPEGLFSSVLRSVPEGLDSVTEAIVLELIKGNIPLYIGEILGLTKEEMQSIPGDVGMNMIADWLELNLTENFLKGAGRAIKTGKKIMTHLESAKSSSTTVIRPLKSEDTHSDKLKAS